MLLVAGCAIAGCSSDQIENPTMENIDVASVNRDIEVVDDYLEQWDRFAQGDNQLVPFLRDNKVGFEAASTRLLRSGDRGAAARMVFYAVVQVGGSIPVDSNLGKASASILGPDFTVTTMKNGDRVYFAGDLYFWWEANRGKFEAYPLFEEWRNREFAKSVAIPMYQSTSKRK
jgi:hypothetical protein